MNKLNFLINKRNLFVVFSFVIIAACNAFQDDETILTSSVTDNLGNTGGSYTVLPRQDPYMLRTLHRANELDLETPLRCNVNWKIMFLSV